MQGFGHALRARAAALGLSDSEVARRLGMSQARYHNYVVDSTEPDLATLVRICRTLDTSPDQLLGFGAEAGSVTPNERARARLSSAATALEGDDLTTVADMVDAMLEVRRRRLAAAGQPGSRRKNA